MAGHAIDLYRKYGIGHETDATFKQYQICNRLIKWNLNLCCLTNLKMRKTEKKDPVMVGLGADNKLCQRPNWGGGGLGKC